MTNQSAPPQFVTLPCERDPNEGWVQRSGSDGASIYSSASLAASLKIATNISRVSLPVCVF
jgi:hypothetical protein